VIDRLKKQNVSAFQDLENLLALLEKKHKDTVIIKALSTSRDQGVIVKSLKELK
jgi:competence protein ComGF